MMITDTTLKNKKNNAIKKEFFLNYFNGNMSKCKRQLILSMKKTNNACICNKQCKRHEYVIYNECKYFCNCCLNSYVFADSLYVTEFYSILFY